MEIWNRLTYRQRTIAFLLAFVVLAIIVFTSKISATLEQRNQLSELSDLQNNATIDQEISLLNAEQRYYDKLLGRDRKDLESINKEIIAYVSGYSDSIPIELIRMPKAHAFVEQGYNVYTHSLTIKGRFKDLLGMVHFFETQTSGMKLGTTRFYSLRDPRTKRKELYAELYIQSYEKG